MGEDAGFPIVLNNTTSGLDNNTASAYLGCLALLHSFDDFGFRSRIDPLQPINGHKFLHVSMADHKTFFTSGEIN